MPAITFKKHEKDRWRAQEPFVDIRYQNKDIGLILSPDIDRKRLKWRVKFMFLGSPADNPNCPWHWAMMKQEFDDEQAARDWIKQNKDKILALDLYYMD